MRIVFATSELAPCAKTGGLADVAAALPDALVRIGVEVTVMVPLYRSVRESGLRTEPLAPAAVEVPHGPGTVSVGLEGPVGEGTVREGTAREGPVGEGRARVVFLRYDPYFDRPEPYGGDGGYPDNARRFGLFSRAVIAAAEALDLQPDIFHANDWQTALVCANVATVVGPRPRTLLTIHNMAHQGIFWKWDLPWTGLDWSLFNPDGVEFFGDLNLLKAGIVFADAVNTVSPTYAAEIASSPDYGRGLEGVLRAREDAVSGILNGIDTSVWSPETDKEIAANYSARDLAGKAVCRAALEKELGLSGEPNGPLIAFIGRLAEQKGIPLLVDATEKLLRAEPGCRLAVLGTGEERFERAFADLARRYPRTVSVNLRYDDALAHRIEAGADVIVMPSLFEPCGLSQLYGMAYGTIPVVRATGGLADTVEDSRDTDSGTGFVFAEFRAGALLAALVRAVKRYRDREAWGALQRRAMARDWSWSASARRYAALYQEILARQSPVTYTRLPAARGTGWPGRTCSGVGRAY